MPSENLESRVSVPEIIDQLTMVLADMHAMSDLGNVPSLVRLARDELIQRREIALEVLREQDIQMSELQNCIIPTVRSKADLAN